jgi:hypothetical protein
MKYLLISIFILVSIRSFSQDQLYDSIKYRLYIYYSCEYQIKKITEYRIQDRTSDTIVEYESNPQGICTIPNNSNSSYYIDAPLVFSKLSIDKNAHFITDTITIPPIYYAPINNGFYIGPTYYQYYICGEQCHGLLKSFREDGQLWQKGRFKRGKIKYLKSYYPSGSLESKIYKRLLDGCDVTYNKSGRLTLKLSYFLLISRAKIYDEKNDNYIKNTWIGRYNK